MTSWRGHMVHLTEAPWMPAIPVFGPADEPERLIDCAIATWMHALKCSSLDELWERCREIEASQVFGW